MQEIPALLNIPKQKIETIVNNPEKSARAVDLIYITDKVEGIIRLRKGKRFEYVYAGKIICCEEDIKRINSLVIPPAWENVWICKLSNGHLQATGTDTLNRKQYKYHALWNALRNHTKFYRLHAFGKCLPNMMIQLEKDILLPGLQLQKVLATIVSLMERTHIRIGNNFYEKLYGSFGLTTLKDKHVSIKGTELRFVFKGKKGVSHDIYIKNRRLASIVQQCKDIPGKELFQYYDDNGDRKSIDSGMVNEYIKTISGGDFTAKDFRTWAGSVEALVSFQKMEVAQTGTEKKKNIVTALDEVSDHLGNTRTVCKKYYVHPLILSMYEDDKLQKHFEQQAKFEENKNNGKMGLTTEEQILMKILSSN
jgi:DNA topoisomerase-1